MSLRTVLLPIADQLRALAGPSQFDVRTSQLTVRTRTWSNGRRGSGTSSDVDLVIPQIYKFQRMEEREISGSGGRFAVGDIKVGPITPAYTGGGFTEDQLKPPVTTDGIETIYVVTGAHPGEYDLIELQSHKAFSYFLVLRRRRTSP